MTTNHTPSSAGEDGWVSVNDHLDYGRGFISTGIADAIHHRFGVFPRFGLAGGCVNMLLALETGHLVNITDIGSSDLTAVDQRTDAHGFTVAVYTQAGFETGDPLIALEKPIASADLLDLIAHALRALAGPPNTALPSPGAAHRQCDAEINRAEMPRGFTFQWRDNRP